VGAGNRAAGAAGNCVSGGMVIEASGATARRGGGDPGRWEGEWVPGARVSEARAMQTPFVCGARELLARERDPLALPSP